MIEIIEEENVIEYIADSYGLFHQELQLIQEMSELTQAITKTMLCIKDESLKGNVDEEIADVEIMLEQVKYLRGNQDNVEQIKSQKIDRQLRRIKDTGREADWKERFKAEYDQLKIRYFGLMNMCGKWDRNELNFEPTCPRGTYELQLESMRNYMTILEMRAVMEGIELDTTASTN